MSLLLRRVKSIRVGVMAAGLLSGCNIVPPSSPHDIYRLPSSSVTASGVERTDLSLRIQRPSANELLNSTRIVVVPKGNRLNVYKGVRWSSPAPVLWSDHLLDAFRNDGRIERLSAASERLRADVELISALRAFQVEYQADVPEVVIRLDAQLVEITGKHILASRRFIATEAVKGREISEVIEAFGRASDALATVLIDWTLRELGRRDP